jgi:hypothetical protein
MPGSEQAMVSAHTGYAGGSREYARHMIPEAEIRYVPCFGCRNGREAEM